MATNEQEPFTITDLERLLKEAEPAALLVPPRVLRRVIKQDRDIGGIGLVVPHSKSYVIAREPLLHIAERGELGLGLDEFLPDKVILLVRPEADRLMPNRVKKTLARYWRMLFHARLDFLMQEKLANGTLNAQTVRLRIERLGTTEFAEIEQVMRQEKYLLPPETPATVYAEFVAVYWTLRRFSPHLLANFFPCLHDLDAVDALASENYDIEQVFGGTRLSGAPLPVAHMPNNELNDDKSNLAPGAQQLAPPAPIGDDTLRRLEIKAQDMDARGNNVRAAILRTRAAEGANLTLAGARRELDHLARRLQKALELSDVDAENWRKALLPLLGRAARGIWSQEARFLYDLQKACVDSERGIFAVDVIEWCLSLGKRPIRRPLPGHEEVAIVRHLRGAMDRMRHVRLANGERQALTTLLQQAVEHRERLMRDRFRPLIAQSMEDVSLQPHNVPEEIGRQKLIEELLDRVVDYGHLNIGNLRDTISRNELKLPDLKGPVEFLLGDPLIRLNRKLAVRLDGVYRRGEIYMRWLHRLSSVAFGTALGRLLVLFLILPFGLGFFVMITPRIAIEEGENIAQLVGIMEKPPVETKSKKAEADKLPDDDLPAADGATHTLAQADRVGRGRHTFPMPNLWGVAGFGVFFFLLFHVGTFRNAVFSGVGTVGRGLQTIFIHSPAWVLQLPLLQAVLHNRIWVRLRRFVFWPAAGAFVGGWAAWWWGEEPAGIDVTAAASGAVVLILLNTRVGRDLEETTTDMLLRVWVWCTVDFLPGLVRFIMDLSRLCLEAVEQVLYTVNEWLRFRGGQSWLMMVAKGVLSFIWFWVTYVLRFVINILVEPQINPIKHFPVVTVSHKVCLPTIPLLRDVLVQQFGMQRSRALGYATSIIFGIPGIFGFAVWELKENWKLYASNRAGKLKPELIGSHGETMMRFLKPGFHSGTVPKLFRRLRRAERRGQQRGMRKVLAALHHVEESISHFVEREVLALLRQSSGWHGQTIGLAKVHLATNRIALILSCPDLGPDPLMLGIDLQSGWMLAGVLNDGWLPRLKEDQRRTLAAALAGLYKKAGVHLTREAVAAELAPTRAAFSITEEGLTVWPAPDFAKEIVYDLNEEPTLTPFSSNGPLPPGLRSLDTSRVLFTAVPVSWQDWVRTWDGGRGELAYRVLP